jgi:cob(I)alamin adenosyltransferase
MQCSATLAGSRNTAYFISDGNIQFIENQIDALQEKLPPLRGFIIAGGGMPASQCHIARCVCRRAERHCILIDDDSVQHRNILVLLNRISDYLIVLARSLGNADEVSEELWKQ